MLNIWTNCLMSFGKCSKRYKFFILVQFWSKHLNIILLKINFIKLSKLISMEKALNHSIPINEMKVMTMFVLRAMYGGRLKNWQRLPILEDLEDSKIEKDFNKRKFKQFFHIFIEQNSWSANKFCTKSKFFERMNE